MPEIKPKRLVLGLKNSREEPRSLLPSPRLFAQSATVTRKKIAGMEVASLLALLF